MPKWLHLTVNDGVMLLFLEKNCSIPYDDWPKEFKLGRVLDKFKRRGYVNRKYDPTRYGLTRSGFSLVRWLNGVIEHTNSKAG